MLKRKIELVVGDENVQLKVIAHLTTKNLSVSEVSVLRGELSDALMRAVEGLRYTHYNLSDIKFR